MTFVPAELSRAASPSYQSSPEETPNPFNSVSLDADDLARLRDEQQQQKERERVAGLTELLADLKSLSRRFGRDNSCELYFDTAVRPRVESFLAVSPLPASLPTELNEALEAFEMTVRNDWVDNDVSRSDVRAARSRLEGLFREQRREISDLRERLSSWEEDEARVCPEDFGMEEYIPILERRLSSLKEDAEKLADWVIGDAQFVDSLPEIQAVARRISSPSEPQERVPQK